MFSSIFFAHLFQARFRTSVVFLLGSGALLSLPVPARRQHTRSRRLGKWIIMHINLWFAVIGRLGLGITRMEDIVLVTGCHLATSFANIAFSEARGEEQVSFGIRVRSASTTSHATQCSTVKASSLACLDLPRSAHLPRSPPQSEGHTPRSVRVSGSSQQRRWCPPRRQP